MMSILRANLRLLGEHPLLWVMYAIAFLVVAVCSLLAVSGLDWTDVLFPLLTMVVFPIGQMVAAMQVEILSCPFTLMLPGPQSAVRPLVFRVGLVVSLGVTLIVVLESLAAGHAILRFWLTFSAALAVFFIGAGVTYVFALPGFGIALLGMLVGPVGSVGLVDTTLVQILLDYPVRVAIAGPLSTVVAWWFLGRPPWRLPAGLRTRGWLSGRSNRGPVNDRRYVNSASDGLILNLVRASRRPGSAEYVSGRILRVAGAGRRREKTTGLDAYLCIDMCRLSLVSPFDGHHLDCLEVV